jgi:hypothetical protein
MIVSKSRYLAGLQCTKLLWHHFNAKEKFHPVDEKQPSGFDQGREVGNLAKTLFSEGIEVSKSNFELPAITHPVQQQVRRRR